MYGLLQDLFTLLEGVSLYWVFPSEMSHKVLISSGSVGTTRTPEWSFTSVDAYMTSQVGLVSEGGLATVGARMAQAHQPCRLLKRAKYFKLGF